MNIPITFFPESLKYPDTQQVAERLWIVEKPFFAQYGKTQIIIPPGWQTDYGSVPKVCWNVIEPIGQLSTPYILHDWLYCTEMFKRNICDWIFLLAMQDAGASWLKRNTIYSAVRSCGGSVWNETGHADKASENRRLLDEFRIELLLPDNIYNMKMNPKTGFFEH